MASASAQSFQPERGAFALGGEIARGVAAFVVTSAFASGGEAALCSTPVTPGAEVETDLSDCGSFNFAIPRIWPGRGQAQEAALSPSSALATAPEW